MKPSLPSFQIYRKEVLMADVEIIDFNEVHVTYYTDDFLYRPFRQTKVDMIEVNRWLATRCFPKTRGNVEHLLELLGLKEYSPVEIVKKTHGVMFEDFLWIKFKGEEISYEDVKIRD